MKNNKKIKRRKDKIIKCINRKKSQKTKRQKKTF